MTDLDFPKGMPYPLISSGQISLAPTYERVQFDAGNSRNVPGRDSVPEYRTLQFLMTNEQLAIFTLWYRGEAANGAKNFNLEVRTELGLINQECKFAASGTSTPYTREPISSNHWRLTFPVEYVERKTLPIGWPSDSKFLRKKMEIDILTNKVWPQWRECNEHP